MSSWIYGTTRTPISKFMYIEDHLSQDWLHWKDREDDIKNIAFIRIKATF